MELEPGNSYRKTQKDDLTREQPRLRFQAAKAWRHLSISKAAACCDRAEWGTRKSRDVASARTLDRFRCCLLYFICLIVAGTGLNPYSPLICK